MAAKVEPFYSLRSSSSQLIIDCRRDTPCVLYFGSLLGDETTIEMLMLLDTRQEAKASPEQQPPLSLSPEFSRGFLGNAGIQAHRSGKAWDAYLVLKAVRVDKNDNALEFISRSESASIEVIHRIALDRESNVLEASTELLNFGIEPLQVDQCNAPTFPVPATMNRILGFSGKWANEFQLQDVNRTAGIYLRENRSGRTSNDNFPGVMLHTAQTNESYGSVLGFHLGWSGNHQVRVEEQSQGQTYAQLGELFYPGELKLDENQSYLSPNLYVAQSEQGFSELSNRFHKFVRSRLSDQRTESKPRPVHFNTWEAMYFDLDLERLFKLAEQAAEVGVERFVLDDGWFHNRTGDSAGLGDWIVDNVKFPNGLTPIVDYVRSLGMEFGIWIEPEMVNPDSDLYRAHPNWVLGAGEAPKLLFRNQLVLDLSQPEVFSYLFERIDELLTENEIGYLKWDMNRDLNQPVRLDGTAGTHYQTLALYELLKKVRAAHPNVEIETCSSGGARADFGILRYTDRVWTSDNNDSIDRLRIQKGFSYFFPPEIMGTHVGPQTCHITGRSLPMATRAGVALLGSMGVEANLLEIEDEDRDVLKKAIGLHKRHRELIKSGELVRLDMPSYEQAFGIVSEDKTEAIFTYALTQTHPHSSPGRLFFRGLRSKSSYRIDAIWPLDPASHSKSILDVVQNIPLTGEALMKTGMQLPIMLPASVLVLHLAVCE